MHFQIHNGVRDPQTRTQRAQRPTHEGLVQYVMNGRRLIRGRPIKVHEDELKKHIHELREKSSQGILYVTNLAGQEVNLWTGQLGKSVPPANWRPNIPQDDAAQDKATGVPMNVHAKEPAPPAEFSMPVPPPVAAIDNPLKPVGTPAQNAETQPPPPEESDEELEVLDEGAFDPIESSEDKG